MANSKTDKHGAATAIDIAAGRRAMALGEAFAELLTGAREREDRRSTELKRIADPLADWHVVEIVEGRARNVVREFGKAGIPVYRPERMVREHIARGGRMVARVVARPFFPGYLLLRFDVRADWAWLADVDGVVDIMLAAGTDHPATVPANFIAAIVAKERELDKRWRLLKRLAAFPFDIGDQVRIVDGAFSAAVGFIAGLNPRGRIKLDVPDVMGRTVTVEVDADQIGTF
jgi:transcription antitermination factor NusG